VIPFQRYWVSSRSLTPERVFASLRSENDVVAPKKHGWNIRLKGWWYGSREWMSRWGMASFLPGVCFETDHMIRYLYRNFEKDTETADDPRGDNSVDRVSEHQSRKEGGMTEDRGTKNDCKEEVIENLQRMDDWMYYPPSVH